MAENKQNDLLGAGGFAALLQNPQITERLPQILEALSPIMAEMQGGKQESAPDEVQAAKEVAPPSASPDALLVKLLGGNGKQREGSANRLALLHALKPFLSDNRKEAMEYICKVSGLLDILAEVM